MSDIFVAPFHRANFIHAVETLRAMGLEIESFSCTSETLAAIDAQSVEVIKAENDDPSIVQFPMTSTMAQTLLRSAGKRTIGGILLHERP